MTTYRVTLLITFHGPREFVVEADDAVTAGTAARTVAHREGLFVRSILGVRHA